MTLGQPFETGELEVFSNLDLNQARILNSVQDQVTGNEITYLGQECISIYI